MKYGLNMLPDSVVNQDAWSAKLIFALLSQNILNDGTLAFADGNILSTILDMSGYALYHNMSHIMCDTQWLFEYLRFLTYDLVVLTR